MSKLNEQASALVKGIINSAMKSTKENGKQALSQATNPFQTSNTKPNSKRVNRSTMKLKENLTKLIRVAGQVSDDPKEKGIGDDTNPFVDDKDPKNEIALRRRKARKRFFNSIDSEG